MRGLWPWLAKALFSAAYWLAFLYIGTGLFFGDRITSEGIALTTTAISPLLFLIIALGLYAMLSFAWDRLISTRQR